MWRAAGAGIGRGTAVIRPCLRVFRLPPEPIWSSKTVRRDAIGDIAALNVDPASRAARRVCRKVASGDVAVPSTQCIKGI